MFPLSIPNLYRSILFALALLILGESLASACGIPRPEVPKLEPYTIERAAAYQRSQNNLFSCYYDKAERVGEWLSITRERRSYCLAGGICASELYLSSGWFLLYLQTHPSPLTFLYLLPALALFNLVIGCWIHEMGVFGYTSAGVKKMAFDILFISPLTLDFLFFEGFILVQLLGWVMAGYLVASYLPRSVREKILDTLNT